MISVVCVYNDQDKLERRLLASINRQSVRCDLVTVDNSDGEFQNASTALNLGASRAKGDWILFVHQDVALLSEDWLCAAEELLRTHNPSGWSGVAGVTRFGEGRGLLRDSAMLRGQAFDGLVEVQTLDEVVLIHKREQSPGYYFDHQVPGWHAYGVEACCRAVRAGNCNYVMALPIWHDTERRNLQGLSTSHRYVWNKHGPALGEIFTTCGQLRQAGEANGSSLLSRGARRARAMALRVRGFKDAYLKWFDETLESCTEGAPVIECLHSRAPLHPIEAEAFVPLPRTPRRVVHRFSGFELKDCAAECVVVTPNLASRLSDTCEEVDWMRNQVRRLLVCLNMNDAKARRALWRSILRRTTDPRLTLESNGGSVAVLEVRRPR